uniref:Putative secreted protein n=1 Tax=Anopheles darlingi TaxID=43151 RepID=A0A2M4DAI6_ANODA
MFRDVLLVFAVILLAKLQDPVAQPEDVLERSILRITEFIDPQKRSIVRFRLLERALQDLEQLLQDVLFP